MMFKVLSGNLVVDVLQKVKWVRFLRKFDDVVVTDKTSADGFYGSDNKTIYRLEGKYCPPSKPYKIGTLVAITEEECNHLSKQLTASTSSGLDLERLKIVRDNKIKQLSSMCKQKISEGIKIRLSDKKYHTFSLTLEDQQNISNLYAEILQGAKTGLYHEDGKLCQFYTESDIRTLFQETQKHIKYHTTYFNLLKNRILELTSTARIQEIYYGIDLVKIGVDLGLLQKFEEVLNG